MRRSLHSIKFLFAAFLLLRTIDLCSQVTNCPYDLVVSGDLAVDSSFLAENSILCNDTIPPPVNLVFSAPTVFLDSLFTVSSGASLTSDTAGCEATCIPDSSPCQDTCISPLIDSITSSGQRYVKGEVVLTFPDSITVDMQQSGPIISTGGTTYHIGDSLNKLFPKINPTLMNPGILRRCLCGKNIFIYENDNLIFDEGGVVSSNKKQGVSEEGGVFSLNYILEYGDPVSPDSIVKPPLTTGFNDIAGPGSVLPTYIVAILDSGVDPALLSPSSHYYNNNPTSFICSLKDTAGWNFVNNSHNLFDDRGHGTLVTLSYLHALRILKPIIDTFRSQILTVKVLNECGEGTTYSTVCGLHYAQMKGARVINASWGMYQNEFQLQRAVREVTKQNVRIVCSSGNRGLDLTENEHFPSGYAYSFNKLFPPDSNAVAPGIGRVYAVAGACRGITAPCMPQRVNLPLDLSSNFRDSIFAEASRNVELLLPPFRRPGCQIQGTSFAAPQLSAALMQSLIQTGTATKGQIVSKSKRIHPARNQLSFFLNNCK